MFFKKQAPVDLSLAGINKFIEFTKQFSISSLSAGRPGARITVYQNPDGCAVVSTPVSEVVTEPVATPAAPVEEKIKSGTVGVFVPVKGIENGYRLKKGQVTAKIAAMKIEHEVLAEKECVIKKVLVKANDLIEYGQPLFIIE